MKEYRKQEDGSPVERRKGTAKTCEMPDGAKGLTSKHTNYLMERNFPPRVLRGIWGLKGTGNVGPYKFRIIAPIFVDGVLVSYQGRGHHRETDSQV